MNTPVRRRALLGRGASLAAAATLGAPELLLAQTDPIRIGVTNALSGVNAIFGESNVLG